MHTILVCFVLLWLYCQFFFYDYFISLWVAVLALGQSHNDVIKWKHFPHYWPFVRGIHRSPVNSPHKGQWRGALMFSLICPWTNSWANKDAGDLRCHRAHHDVIVMSWVVTLALGQYCRGSNHEGYTDDIIHYPSTTNITKCKPWAYFLGYTVSKLSYPTCGPFY